MNITNGIKTLRDLAQRFGNSLTVVRVRGEFTKDLIDLLRAGADDLVLADQNEEAANILALQTRQQLAYQSLSIGGAAGVGHGVLDAGSLGPTAHAGDQRPARATR